MLVSRSLPYVVGLTLDVSFASVHRDLDLAQQEAAAARAAAVEAAAQLEEQRAAADERQRRFHMLNSGFKRKEDALKEALAAAEAAAAEARDVSDEVAQKLVSATEARPSRFNFVCHHYCRHISP